MPIAGGEIESQQLSGFNTVRFDESQHDPVGSCLQVRFLNTQQDRFSYLAENPDEKTDTQTSNDNRHTG